MVVKQKKVDRLTKVLKSIVDDEDDGKEYLNSCIYDYIRILSCGLMENVEIYIDNSAVRLENNVNEDILLSFDEITQSIEKMTISPDYVNNILLDNDINMNDMCINKDSKYLSQDRNIEHSETERFYYSPEQTL